MGKGRNKDTYDETPEYEKEEYQYKRREKPFFKEEHFFNEGPRDYPVEFGGGAYQRLGVHQFPANNRRDRLPRTFDLYHQGLLDARFPQWHSLDQQ